MKYYLVFLLLSSVSLDLIAKQDLVGISNSRVWQKLLHLYDDKSEIENQSFFLSTFGENFAYRELLATISAIKANEISEKGFTFRCLFPARTTFLASYGLVKDIENGECKSLENWIGSQNYDVSIIYADGFLGNPASFYGHLILKIDHLDNPNPLFNNSLNFGAGVADSENKIVYVLKGLFGGYEAEYTSNYFYRHNLNYTEAELRDLWRYKLNLDDQQKRLVVYHAWELMRSKYTYYFTHRNCAYHIAKLIEVVTDKDLISKNHPFVLPISVFKSAITQTNQTLNEPLIGDIEYLPSRQTRLRAKASRLEPNLLEKLDELISGNIVTSLNGLNTEDKISLLDTAYDYIEFVLTQVEKDSEEWQSFKKKLNQLQLMRIRLPKASSNNQVDTPQTLPHEGHNPSLLRFSAGSGDNNSFQEITLRPAFYDLNSFGGGMLDNSALSMLEINLRISNDDVQISNIDLLNIETYPTGGTGLEFDSDLAWKTRVGYERNYTDALKNTGEWFLDGGVGKTLKINDNLVAYANADIRLQTPDSIGNKIFLNPNIGFLFSHKSLRLNCSLAYAKSLNNAYFDRRKQGCSASLFQNQTLDLRLRYESYFTSEWKVGLSWYW